MEIKREIANHLEWIEGVSELLGSSQLDNDKLAAISRHDQCALGQWLESDEAQDRASPGILNDIRQRHERFHQLAGELIAAAQNNDEQDALALQQAFLETSHHLIVDLTGLRDSANPPQPSATPSGNTASD
jgi:hypothetical protein